MNILTDQVVRRRGSGLVWGILFLATTLVTIVLPEICTGSNDDPVGKKEPSGDDKREIVGTLYDQNGNPIPEFEVEVFRQDGRREPSLKTDLHGQFHTPRAWWTDFAGERPRYVLVARNQNHQIGWLEIPSGKGLDGKPHPIPDEFAITLIEQGRRVTGRLVGPNKQPIEGVLVQASRLTGVMMYDFGMNDRLPFGDSRTDASGTFEIFLPSDASVTLCALHRDWVWRNIVVALDDQLGDIEMIPGSQIRGTVVDQETGKPLANVRVKANCTPRLRSKGIRDKKLGESGFATTDEQGAFEIGGLREEFHYVEVVSHPLGPQFLAAIQGIEARQREPATVKIPIGKGVLVKGRVIEAQLGEPIPRMLIKASVTWPDSRTTQFIDVWPETDDVGEFEFYSLPGRAQLGLSYRNDEWKTTATSSLAFEIAGPKPIEVTLSLEKISANLLKPPVLHTLFGSTAVHSFVFHPSGSQIVTAGSQLPVGVPETKDGWQQARGDIRVWDVKSGKEVGRLGVEYPSATEIAISPDGNSIAVTERDRATGDQSRVRIWNLETFQSRFEISGRDPYVRSVAFSPDGQRFASIGAKMARLFDAATGDEVAAFSHQQPLLALAFGTEGKQLATATTEGEITLWDIEKKSVSARFRQSLAMFSGIDWSSDGKRFALACIPFEADGKTAKYNSGIVKLWDIAQGRDRTFVRDSGTLLTEYHPSDVAFSPTGNFVAAAAHVVGIWSTADTKDRGQIQQTSSSTGDKIRFSPDGKILAISSFKSGTLWDVSRLEETNSP